MDFPAPFRPLADVESDLFSVGDEGGRPTEWTAARLVATHQQRTTVQHWQLRHLMSADGEHALYVVFKNKLVRYDTETKESRTVVELSYAPTSLDVGCGYAAVCGQEGQLSLCDVASGRLCVDTVVSRTVNNGLQLAQCDDGVRLLVANNDSEVRVFHITRTAGGFVSLVESAVVRLPVAANYAAVSPCGRRMVAAGDSPDVYVYSVGNGEESFRRTAVVREAKDNGFSCAWHPNSNVFAVASQDGLVVVWDVRGKGPLARLSAVQSSRARGACRSVKFAHRGGIDLLAFAEHVTYAHLVDARTYDSHQWTRAGQGNVSGLAFSASCARFFVALETNIAEYAVDSVARRAFPDGGLL